MKRLAIVLAAAAAAGLAGCGSPSIDAWAARGSAGVGIERQNVSGIYEKMFALNAQQRARYVDAAFRDIRLRRDQLDAKDPNSGITNEWLDGAKKFLETNLEATETERAELSLRFRAQLEHLASIDEAFGKIQGLNHINMSTTTQLLTTVQDLAAEVRKLRAERAVKNE